MDTESEPALRLEAVEKAYGSAKKAVSNISLKVARGEVYGFLGPNGAGKSTTIRMALGLIRPTAGRIFLFGEQVGLGKSFSRVGSLVDGGTFYPHLSGEENLRVLTRTQGRGQRGIPELLSRVGLTATGSQKVKAYSLGMRQRLGVAAALANNPDLVVLDEPTNGLDAAGIQEMRSLIRSLADEGKAVFLSSHLLNEVQQVCDRVAIVARGSLIREATITELIGSTAGIEVLAHPQGRATEILSSTWKTEQRRDRIWLSAAESDVPDIVRRLVTANIDVLRIGREEQSLEEVFLSLTRDE